MLLDVTDLEGAYRRHAARQVGAVLKQLYEPIVTEALPPQHAALLERLQRREAVADESQGDC